MATHQRVHSRRPRENGSPRTTVEGSARSLRRLPDGSSAVSKLVQGRSAASGARRSGPRSPRTRRTRLIRVLHRWQLCSGQKGGARVGKTKRGKGCKIMAIGDAHGLPVAIHSEAASPAEVKLVGTTHQARLVDELPLRLIADRAYDSDPLRKELPQSGSAPACSTSPRAHPSQFQRWPHIAPLPQTMRNKWVYIRWLLIPAKPLVIYGVCGRPPLC